MKNPAHQPVPATRKEGLLVRELSDETLVYDLHNHKAHCLNQTAALIWKYCDGQNSESDIVRFIEGEQNTTVHPDVVRFGVLQLRRTHLLETQISGTPGDAALSRRDLIKRLGATAAIGLPLVASLLAPTAAEASTGGGGLTCAPGGAPCNTNADCCSNACKNGTCADDTTR